MTSQAEQLAEEHLERHDSELERARRESDAEAPTGATVAYLALALLGAAGFAVLWVLRAPLWRAVSTLPWWSGWLIAALLIIWIWRRS